MRRLLLIIASACAVIAVALAVGVLRPGLTTPTLQRHAERSVAACMHRAGFGHAALTVSRAEEQSRSPRLRALELCWSAAAKDARFERLDLIDPIVYNKELREKGLDDWRCVEKSGYARTTPIPLSGPGGYPLQLAAGNFRVGSSGRDLKRFYSKAAECSGDPIDTYRWSDGTFSPDPADGVKRCVRHEHNGSGPHAHGCYGLTTYPDPTAH